LSDDTVQGVRRCYTPAFIEIVNANLVSGLNPRTQIPFRLTAGVGLLDGNGGIFNNAKDLYDSQLFWAHTLVFGYQPDTSSDADPSTERPEEGVTAKREGFYVGGVSAVFVESVREVTGSVLAGGTPVPYKQANYYGRLYGTAAHEIGHAPGDQTAAEDHAEQGLMHEDGIGLSSTPELEVEAVTVKRFRNTQRWSE
jgi:hypothetical protein